MCCGDELIVFLHSVGAYGTLGKVFRWVLESRSYVDGEIPRMKQCLLWMMGHDWFSVDVDMFEWYIVQISLAMLGPNATVISITLCIYIWYTSSSANIIHLPQSILSLCRDWSVRESRPQLPIIALLLDFF